MSTNKPQLKHEDITEVVIKAFFDVYNELAGFPEFVLRRAMAIAVRDAGLSAAEEVSLPVWFRGHQIVRFRADSRPVARGSKREPNRIRSTGCRYSTT